MTDENQVTPPTVVDALHEANLALDTEVNRLRGVLAATLNERDEAQYEQEKAAHQHREQMLNLRAELSRVDAERSQLHDACRTLEKDKAEYLGHLAAFMERLGGMLGVPVDSYEAAATLLAKRMVEIAAASAGLPPVVAPATPTRRKLLDERRSRTYKLRIGVGEAEYCPTCRQSVQGEGHPAEALVHCGYYEDGGLGEVFITADPHLAGNLAAVALHMLAVQISISLQHGIPPKIIAGKLAHQQDVCGGYPMVEVDGKLVSHPTLTRVAGLHDYLALTIEDAAAKGPQ